ncbi:hypothetical protein HER10_EVM0011498 [Colletotrichum scovillei]|uniref:uncharacterized protein n=1 Tax=Colletotrichum scovillei TaxID=1209932 RepID=UPI0015C325E6|nr:uncharacterized protein HER10_EVM0011498 [Colletotrichum scovillei]KAF4785923.1 hypothetical protein HER10_EVM0011498 [Colletotrichum scovillei]
MGRVKSEQPTGKKAQANGRDQRNRGGRGRGRVQQDRMHRIPAPWSARDDFAMGRLRSPVPAPEPESWVSVGDLDRNLQKWMRNGQRDEVLSRWGLGPGEYDILEDRVLADIVAKWPDATVALLYDKAQEAKEHVYRHFAGQGKVRVSLEASDWLKLEGLWKLMDKAHSHEERKYPFDYTYGQIRFFDRGLMDKQYAFYFKKYEHERARAQDAAPAAIAPAAPIAARPMSVPPAAAGTYLIREQAHMPTACMAAPGGPHPAAQGGGGCCTGNHGPGSFVPMHSQGACMMGGGGGGGGMGQAVVHGGTAGTFYPAPQHHHHHHGAQPGPGMGYY